MPPFCKPNLPFNSSTAFLKRGLFLYAIAPAPIAAPAPKAVLPTPFKILTALSLALSYDNFFFFL